MRPRPNRERIEFLSIALAVATLAASCGRPAPPVQAGSAGNPANEAIARRIIEEAWNAGDFAVIDEATTPDRVSHTNGVRDSLTGPAGAKAGIGQVRQQYDGLHLRIDDLFSSEDRVAIRFTFHGTHAQLGKAVAMPGAWIGRFENGKLAEEWSYFDNAAAVTQLGGRIVPPPPPSM